LKRNIKRIIAAVLLICGVIGTSMTGMGAGSDATVQSYEQQIANMEWQIEQAKNELEEIRNQEYATWQEISKLDEIIQYNDQLKHLAQEQLDNIGVQIKETKDNIEELNRQIETQESAFLDRMVQSYMVQDVDYLQLVFESKSLVDFLTRMDTVNSILDYDKQVISQLRKSKDELQLLESKLNEAESIQMDRVAQFESIIKENNSAYESKLNRINQLQSDESSAAEMYEYYNQQVAALNTELENYLAELQRRSQSQYVGGQGGWPLEPGAWYYVSSEQGERILWGSYDYHLGIDLACDNGTPVYSYNAGTVVTSAWHDSYGNYVLIDHGGGIATLYAHMRERCVAAGDYVAAGQLVGYVGLTGNTSGYHLHFEVRLNGVVQNPRNYLVFP
jgi:murein DD-endopeptidase MepM/ murein hydrolase activator NlpD